MAAIAQHHRRHRHEQSIMAAISIEQRKATVRAARMARARSGGESGALAKSKIDIGDKISGGAQRRSAYGGIEVALNITIRGNSEKRQSLATMATISEISINSEKAGMLQAKWLWEEEEWRIAASKKKHGYHISIRLKKS